MQSKNNTFSTMGFKFDSAIEEGFSQDFEEALIQIMYLAQEDARILSLLITWGTIHSKHIIVEKLVKHYKQFSKYRGTTLIFDIFSIYCLSKNDYRFKKLVHKKANSIIFPNRKSIESSIYLKGCCPMLKEYNILIPQNFIRIRKSDISTTEELIKINPQFRNRFIFGPNWRADIIYRIEQGAKSPSEISKTLGCSYEPAFRIWKEYHQAYA